MDRNTQKETYKYRIEQTEKGVKLTVYGDAIEEIVADYIRLRTRLEQEGVRIISESGGEVF